MTKARVNNIAFVEMIYKLTEDCVTVQQLMHHTGLSRGPIDTYLKLLRRKRLIRIAEWRTAVRTSVAAYEWNTDNLHDAKRIPKFTPAERMARFRAKKAAAELHNIISREGVQNESQGTSESGG